MKSNNQKKKDNPAVLSNNGMASVDETVVVQSVVEQIGEFSPSFCAWLAGNVSKEKVQQLKQLTEIIESGKAPAESLMERAQLVLSFWKSGRRRLSEMVNFYNGRDRYKKSDILQVVKKDLLALILHKNGFTLFANWYENFPIRHDGDTETKILDNIFYRVWAEYFKANSTDPKAHLYRAKLLQRMFERPKESNFYRSKEGKTLFFDTEDSISLINESIYENNKVTLNSTQTVETITDANGKQTKWFNNKKWNPPAEPIWYNSLRCKINKEVEYAITLSNNNPKVIISGLLIWPYPVVSKLEQLYRENRFKELIQESRRYFEIIGASPWLFFLEENTLDIRGITENGDNLEFFLNTITFVSNYQLDSENVDFRPWEYFSWGKDKMKILWPKHYRFDQPLFFKQAFIQIMKVCQPAFFARLIIVISGSANVRTTKLLVGLDQFWEQYEFCKEQGDYSSLTDKGIELLLKSYPGFHRTITETLAQDGSDLFIVKLKIAFLEASSIKVETAYLRAISMQYVHYAEQRANQHAQEKYQARINERNLVISELSHHIKNLNATVREPLENLRNQPGVPENILEDALRGTNLIRNIVNAMNLSIGGAKEDFIFDAMHLDDESISLESIIWSALFSAIPNMFDGKHFSKFLRNYFPSRESFRAAQSDWAKASAGGNREDQVDCLRHHFFDLSVEISGESKLIFGDTKGSATKMLILCQEIMMNAVKYASTMEREKRELQISVVQNLEKISIKVVNSCQSETRLKTAGLGHTVIKNFAEILGCEPQITKADNRYILSLEFDNFSHIKQGADV